MRHDDPLIQQVLDTWLPRFLNGSGAFFDDVRWTVERMRSWDDWGPEWLKTAAEREALAEEAWAAGHLFSAVQLFESACNYYHIGYHVYTRDPAAHHHGMHKMIAIHERILPLLEPAVEKVKIPFEHTHLLGLFSRPRTPERPPVVIMIPGLDSTKENRHRGAPAYLKRGMAVLTIDGPGQGEVSSYLPLRAEYEDAITATINYLEVRGDVDATHVGLNGASLGGYYAPRAAAFERRVTACVGNCGPYDLSASFERIPQVTREAFQQYSHAQSMQEAFEISRRLTLHGVAEEITCPLLILYGAQDPLFPWQDGERMVAEARGPKRFVNYPEGNHALNNIPYKANTLAADWLAEQLGGRTR